MASGSILPPSPPNPNAALPSSNGHLSPLAANVTNADDVSAHSESELSDARDAHGELLSSDDDIQNGIPDTLVADPQSEDSSEDQDAEGSEDQDYAAESPLAAESPASSSRSTSEASRTQRKRKASTEDEDFMNKDPELYGLRRSGRTTRPARTLVESSSEEDSDSEAPRSRKRRKRSSVPAKRPSRPTSTAVSSPDSESESDVYVANKRSAPTKKQRRQQLQVAAGLAPPSHAEIRFSGRTTRKVTNYNEDDDDDMFEEDESEMMTPNYWTSTVDENAPAIDLILKHRFKEGADVDNVNPSKHDFEFLIKWQNKAHYHSTWETFESLASYRGFRRLENYFRKTVLEDVRIRTDPDVTPEDKEAWLLDREKEDDSLLNVQKVERVIGTQEGENGTEYFVKWKTIPYERCTWEPASLVSELAQNEIDRFLDRSSKLPVSRKSESSLNTRSPHKVIKSQPEYIKYGDLREFQLKGINFLAFHWCQGHNVILADEMGLGKTVQTVSFMNWLRHDRGQEGPFLVVVPLSTLPAWAETLDNWTPDINYIVYTGNEPSRKIIREYEMLVDGNPKKVKFNVLLTTYEFILADAPFLAQLKWQFLAVDEAHRLKNRDSQLYQRLVEFGVPSRLLITGTPMQNTLGELSALMDFLMPGKVMVEEDIDLQSEDASKKIAQLSDAISPYMIRRTKQKVENDLPPKTEKIIRVELSDIQLEYYKNILTRNYAALNAGSSGQKQSLLNIMMELKKASNHPFMFPNAEDRILGGSNRREDILRGLITSSGKMMLLDQLLTKLKKDNHRVLIFSQMVKMLDLLGDYLSLRGHQFQRLDGTIGSSARQIAIDRFNAPDSKDFCFILSTRAGGLGINLMTADTVILFDSDWNPQADLQAMARAHRIGQKNPVTIYRLVSKDTVEEEVLERARNKLMLEFITIQRGVTDKDNAQQLSDRMRMAGRDPNEPTSSEDINLILKRRGQKMFEQSGNQKRLEELDIDAVLENAEEHKTIQPEGLTSDGGEEFLKSFEYTDVKVDLEWDDIIPKEQLEAIKAEEKRKEDEAYLQSMIEQNAPRKRKPVNEEQREQRAAKRRAREANAEAAADIDSGNESGADNDPKRPLNEKEIRNLIRAYERYGSLEDRGEEIIRDAKLTGRDEDILKATLNDVLTISRRMLKDEQDKLEALEKESNKVLTKKDKKAVLFDYKGVKRLNAETLIERPAEMRMLKEVTEAIGDFRSFRIPEASKPAHYTCSWGAREDGMLCVGIARHGFGAWVAIRDDAELGMTDKLFLEEHRVDKKEERSKGEEKNAKSPGAVHLVRRANYLLSVLKDKLSNGTNVAAKRALENHHRNNKKWSAGKGRGDKATSVSASPVPSSIRKIKGDPDKIRKRGHSHSDSRQSVDRRFQQSERNGTPDQKGTPDLKRKASGEERISIKRQKSEERSHHHHHHHAQGDRGHHRQRSVDSKVNGQSSSGDPVSKLFQPIVGKLEGVRKATAKNFPDKEKRLQVLKVSIISIGNFIRARVQEAKNPSLEMRFWEYVAANYWPNKGAGGDKLKGVYERYLEKETNGAKKEPKGAGQSDGTKVQA